MAKISHTLEGNVGFNHNNLRIEEDPNDRKWLLLTVGDEFAGEREQSVNVSTADFLRLAKAIEVSVVMIG